MSVIHFFLFFLPINDCSHLYHHRHCRYQFLYFCCSHHLFTHPHVCGVDVCLTFALRKWNIDCTYLRCGIFENLSINICDNCYYHYRKCYCIFTHLYTFGVMTNILISLFKCIKRWVVKKIDIVSISLGFCERVEEIFF